MLSIPSGSAFKVHSECPFWLVHFAFWIPSVEILASSHHLPLCTMSHLFFIRSADLYIIRSWSWICLWQLTLGWLKCIAFYNLDACFISFSCQLEQFSLWNFWSGLGLASANLPDILKGLNLNSREKNMFTITAIVLGKQFALSGWQWGLMANYSAAKDVPTIEGSLMMQ